MRVIDVIVWLPCSQRVHLFDRYDFSLMPVKFPDVRSSWAVLGISGVTRGDPCWPARFRWFSGGASGMVRRRRVRGFRGRFRDDGRKSFLAGIGGAAVAVRLSVTVRQVREDGSEVPVDGDLAAALAGPAEQVTGLLSWAAGEAGFLDHGEREEVIGAEGRELQRRLLAATFALDSTREERIAQVTSAAGIPHGSVEAGQSRGLASLFRPVRVTRMAYRNR